MPGNPLVLKLASFMDPTLAEQDQIERWSARGTRLAARTALLHAGDRAESTCLFLAGWGYRFKDLPNGRRQIIGVLLPGDMCDVHGFLLRSADHNIAMLSDGIVARIPSEAMIAGLESQPRLTRALWWSSLVGEGITREWLVNVGQRDAATRMAHLFCELWMRAHRVGLTKDREFILPLTQADLAEALGLTNVHINRMLRQLRELGLVMLRFRHCEIPDIERLRDFAGFNPTYLQMDCHEAEPVTVN